MMLSLLSRIVDDLVVGQLTTNSDHPSLSLNTLKSPLSISLSFISPSLSTITKAYRRLLIPLDSLVPERTKACVVFTLYPSICVTPVVLKKTEKLLPSPLMKAPLPYDWLITMPLPISFSS